jgi:hypothetical protein
MFSDFLYDREIAALYLRLHVIEYFGMNVIRGMQDQTIAPIQFQKLPPRSIHPARSICPKKAGESSRRAKEENDYEQNWMIASLPCMRHGHGDKPCQRYDFDRSTSALR